MKKSKILWFVAFPILVTAAIYLLGLKKIYYYLWPALIKFLNKLIIEFGLTQQIANIFGIIVLFLTLLLLSSIVYSYLNKRKKAGNILLIIAIILIALNYTLSIVSTTKANKLNDIAYSAKSIVEDLVDKNPLLQDEGCKKVKILKKVGDNTYKAIATMESDTEYLIEIEDLGEYIQVRILPSIDIQGE